MLEKQKLHRAAQDKYTYFLLAAAAAAIAYAMKLTASSSFSYSMIPLGIAVLLWAASFFSGCHQLRYVLVILLGNIELERIVQGVHPLIGPDPGLRSTMAETMNDVMVKNSHNANKYAHLQFNFLFVGAGFFVLWHLLEMYKRGVH